MFVMENHSIVVSDAIIFTIMVIADFPLPEWIYPFIFYIQVYYRVAVKLYGVICFVYPNKLLAITYIIRLFHVLLPTSLKNLFQLEDL